MNTLDARHESVLSLRAASRRATDATPDTLHRAVLGVSSLVALLIGTFLALAPVAFHGGNGIGEATSVDLLSELRAPGGALVAIGLLMLAGAVTPRFTVAATQAGAALYLGYGLARLVGFAVDGMPGTALVGATLVELVLGLACAALLMRNARP